MQVGGQIRAHRCSCRGGTDPSAGLPGPAVEGKRNDPNWFEASAHVNRKFGAGDARVGGHVGHRDGMAERRRRRSGRHDTDLLAVRQRHRVAGAGPPGDRVPRARRASWWATRRRAASRRRTADEVDRFTVRGGLVELHHAAQAGVVRRRRPVHSPCRTAASRPRGAGCRVRTVPRERARDPHPLRGTPAIARGRAGRRGRTRNRPHPCSRCVRRGRARPGTSRAGRRSTWTRRCRRPSLRRDLGGAQNAEGVRALHCDEGGLRRAVLDGDVLEFRGPGAQLVPAPPRGFEALATTRNASSRSR